MMTFKIKATLVAVLILSQPVQAKGQSTTSQDVMSAFTAGVTLCTKGLISGGGVEALPATERVALTIAGPDSMLAGRATEGQTIFDVAPAAGIVVMMAKGAGQCEVIGYGPRVLPTFAATKASLSAAFSGLRETKTDRTREDIIADYEVVSASGEKVGISLVGGEPGMGSRRFRFPMFTATISLVVLPAPTDTPRTSTTTSAPLLTPQGVTPASVTAAFAYGVGLCAKSLANGGGIDALPASERADVARADPLTSEYARALPTNKIYDVTSAKDVVILNDGGATQCNVAGFGPRVMPTLVAVKATLAAATPNLSETPVRRRQGDFIGSFTLPQSDGSPITVAVSGREWGVKAPNMPWTAFTAKLTRTPPR
jgi:hypothetical protein